MMQVRVTGIAYRRIAGQSPMTRLALAYRREETSPVVRNFIAKCDPCGGSRTEVRVLGQPVQKLEDFIMAKKKKKMKMPK
jgi:hypothetical protein